MGIIENSDLGSQIKQLKQQKNSIVFTNGCFDLLHKGHIDLLNKASTFGDILIVGLNSDNSVKTFCLLYTSPSPRDGLLSRMPSSA